jgi:hypothetical protein
MLPYDRLVSLGSWRKELLQAAPIIAFGAA